MPKFQKQKLIKNENENLTDYHNMVLEKDRAIKYFCEENQKLKEKLSESIENTRKKEEEISSLTSIIGSKAENFKYIKKFWS